MTNYPTELTPDQLRIIGHQLLIYSAIGCLYKAIRIDLPIRRQVPNQTNVWTFRRLNGTDTAIVGTMHITHIKTSPLTRETARAERRQTPLMPDLRQRTRLVHKLRQLAAAEKFLHRRHHRTNINQRIWRRLPRLLDTHALLHHP